MPADLKVGEKEREKVKKHQDLKREIIETKNCRSRPCNDRSPWKCHKRI